jgi:hypothetical protein
MDAGAFPEKNILSVQDRPFANFALNKVKEQ